MGDTPGHDGSQNKGIGIIQTALSQILSSGEVADKDDRGDCHKDDRDILTNQLPVRLALLKKLQKPDLE